jgi:Flp pilus assembly pilin Flp
MKRLHGQAVLEYVLLIGIITVVLFAMMQAIKRATQSLVKTTADEIGNQVQADQFVILNNGDQVPNVRQGYMEFSNSISTAQTQKQVVERVGIINYIYDDRQTTLTDAQTNLGLIEQ